MLPVGRQTHRHLANKALAGGPKMFQGVLSSEEGGGCVGKLPESDV